MDDFQKALSLVLPEEGGFSNHPKDPGGATMKGVTQKVYDAYRGRKKLPVQTVRKISENELEEIYRNSYWLLAKCPSLPSGVNYVVFDGAVNSGVSQSIKWLQRAVGTNPDGVIGPTTIAAVNAYESPSRLIDSICDQRLKFLKALKTWKTFGKGWEARVSRVRKNGKAFGSSKIQTLTATHDGDAKAYVSDVKKGPSAATGDALAGAGGMGATLTQGINTLLPMSNIEFVSQVITYLTIGSVLLGIGGLAYGMYARWKKSKIKEDAGTEPTL